MSEKELTTSAIYTVRRVPITAGAKYVGVSDFEYMAKSASKARDAAVEDCQYRNPEDNFEFQVIGRRIGKGENK